jgi:ATP-dependent protease ClpP protease subunit
VKLAAQIAMAYTTNLTDNETQKNERTGQPKEKVLADMERDFWMSATEAVKYGMVSRIIERHQDL